MPDGKGRLGPPLALDEVPSGSEGLRSDGVHGTRTALPGTAQGLPKVELQEAPTINLADTLDERYLHLWPGIEQDLSLPLELHEALWRLPQKASHSPCHQKQNLEFY